MCTAFSDGLCHPTLLSFIRLNDTASSKTNHIGFDNAIIIQNLNQRDNHHRVQNQSGFRKSAGCFLAMEKQPAHYFQSMARYSPVHSLLGAAASVFILPLRRSIS